LSEQDRRVFFNTSAKALGNLYVGYAAAVGTAVSEAEEHGVTIYQPSEDVLASIATFSQDNLQNVYATARDKYKIENPEALIGKFDDRVKKWEKLFSDVDRKDAGAIAKIIKAELYDKIDASTYGG
jgi:ppGpp synthetase/RelA/SpoT-type nucleotidyltranferase